MLPKSQRIPRKMFPILLSGNRVYRNDIFLLRIVSNNATGSRFCFSVSKKISKSAVIRNRLRRSGYRLLHHYIPQIKPGLLVLFSFLKIPQNEEETVQKLTSVLKESKLIQY